MGNTGSKDFLLVRVGRFLGAFDARVLFGRNNLADSLVGRFLGFSERIGFLLRSRRARLPVAMVSKFSFIGLYRLDSPETHDRSAWCTGTQFAPVIQSNVCLFREDH